MSKSNIQEQILDDYFNEGVSYAILEAKYGRSEQALRRLVKRAELEGRVRLKPSGDRRSVLTSPPLTRLHKRIGMRFIRWRSIENSYSTPEAADILGMSLNRLHAIEGGIYNWTLLELHYVIERLNWNLIDLMSGADLGDYMKPELA